MMLQEVGQVFNNMTLSVDGNGRFGIPAVENFIPYCCTDDHARSDLPVDTAFFPGEGFNAGHDDPDGVPDLRLSG